MPSSESQPRTSTSTASTSASTAVVPRENDEPAQGEKARLDKTKTKVNVVAVVPTKPVAAEPQKLEHQPAKFLRTTLVILFSISEFILEFNVSALFPAVPYIANDLGIKSDETVWLFTAYQATFAAFMLLVSVTYVRVIEWAALMMWEKIRVAE